MTGAVPRWVWLTEGLALLWSVAYLAVVEALLSSRAILGSGLLPHLPGAAGVACAAAVLLATIAYRRSGRPRADIVAWVAVGPVLCIAVLGLLSIGLPLLPEAALLAASAGGLGDARRPPAGPISYTGWAPRR